MTKNKKTYTIIRERRGKECEQTGTLDELIKGLHSRMR